MRKLTITFLSILALAALAGCSSGGDEGAGAAPPTAKNGSALGDVEERGGEGGGSVASARPLDSSLPEFGPQVVQRATLRLAVAKGDFGEAVDEARSIAGGFGGFVVSSTASQGSEQRLERGTLVLRIPARGYADAMKSLAALGRVEAQNESGQDVSQEYVDLRGRIRQLQAVEGQLLELLDRADSVGAALAVQQRLGQVQLDLEQAQGRLQFLDDQVAFATISLAIHEQVVPSAKKDEGGFGIVEAWTKAANGFLAVVGWTFVVLATIAPALVVLFGLWLLARSAARRKLGAVWPRLKSD
jgi:hypothetical protein